MRVSVHAIEISCILLTSYHFNTNNGLTLPQKVTNQYVHFWVRIQIFLVFDSRLDLESKVNAFRKLGLQNYKMTHC